MGGTSTGDQMMGSLCGGLCKRMTLLIVFFIGVVSIGVSDAFCFEEMLAKSQACSNPRLLYVSLEGGGSGLGSEFNHYLIYALLDAVRKNKRMVYFASKRKWEYDCPEHLGWGCYFNFPCNNTQGVPVPEMDFSDPSTSVHDRDEVKRDYPQLFEQIRDTYMSVKKPEEPDCRVDIKQTQLTSMAAKYLYKLNHQTKHFADRFNGHYGIPQGAEYLSLQIRAQDKKYEMSNEIWEWITHMKNTFEAIKPYVYPHDPKGFKHVYVSTDNCTMLTELTTYLSKEVTIYSPCYTWYHKDAVDIPIIPNVNVVNSNEIHDRTWGGDYNPRNPGEYRSTLRLFAEIEMLVNGVHFFGLLNSNLVRMIHRLRSVERQTNTHGLAYDLTSVDFRCRLDTLES
jgi:hypothetical protein